MYLVLEELHVVEQPSGAASERPTASDLMLAFGLSVRQRLGLRVPLETIARNAGVSVADCLLALEYAAAPDWLKFRAMAEEWSWDDIKRQVSALHGVAVRTPTLDRASRSPAVFGTLSRAEIRRRLWHMLPGLLPFFLATLPHPRPVPWEWLCEFVALALVLTLGAMLTYRTIARSDERHWVLNAVSYPATVIGTLLLFPAHPEFAAVVLTVLAFGDGSATLMGMMFGHRPLPWNRQKTWFGSICFLVIAAPVAALAYWIEARPTPSFGVAAVCGFAATIVADAAESLPTEITDNLRVGVAAAAGVVVSHAALIGSLC